MEPPRIDIASATFLILAWESASFQTLKHGLAYFDFHDTPPLNGGDYENFLFFFFALGLVPE